MILAIDTCTPYLLDRHSQERCAEGVARLHIILDIATYTSSPLNAECISSLLITIVHHTCLTVTPRNVVPRS